MLMEPPIDKMIEMSDSKYALVVALSKRARTLESKEQEMLEEIKQKSISVAAKEFYEGKIEIKKD